MFPFRLTWLYIRSEKLLDPLNLGLILILFDFHLSFYLFVFNYLGRYWFKPGNTFNKMELKLCSEFTWGFPRKFKGTWGKLTGSSGQNVQCTGPSIWGANKSSWWCSRSSHERSMGEGGKRACAYLLTKPSSNSHTYKFSYIKIFLMEITF